MVARAPEKPAAKIETPPQGREGGLLQKERDARAKALAEARRLSERAEAEQEQEVSKAPSIPSKEELAPSRPISKPQTLELKEPSKGKLKTSSPTAGEETQVSARQPDSGTAAKGSRPASRAQPSGFSGSSVPRDGGRPKEILIPEARGPQIGRAHV